MGKTKPYLLMHPKVKLLLRIIAICGLLVFLYLRFTNEEVPGWSLVLFMVCMFIVLTLTFSKSSN